MQSQVEPYIFMVIFLQMLKHNLSYKSQNKFASLVFHRFVCGEMREWYLHIHDAFFLKLK